MLENDALARTPGAGAGISKAGYSRGLRPLPPTPDTPLWADRTPQSASNADLLDPESPARGQVRARSSGKLGGQYRGTSTTSIFFMSFPIWRIIWPSTLYLHRKISKLESLKCVIIIIKIFNTFSHSFKSWNAITKIFFCLQLFFCCKLAWVN